MQFSCVCCLPESFAISSSAPAAAEGFAFVLIAKAFSHPSNSAEKFDNRRPGKRRLEFLSQRRFVAF
jgi:hypothetical protein